MPKYNFDCPVCRDKGRVGGCPKCGKLPQLDVSETQKEIALSEVKDNHIPLSYIDNPWNQDILYEDHMKYSDDPDFEDYCKTLTMVYEAIKQGRIFKNSVLLHSPIGYGKTTWCYSCILELMKHGYNVPPIIDTLQLRQMQVTATERPTWNNVVLGHKYNEYIEADVLFLAVTKSQEYVYAPRLIINILDTRGRLNKPTIIISDWRASSLLACDQSGMLQALMNPGTNVNPFKYLSVTGFTPYSKEGN